MAAWQAQDFIAHAIDSVFNAEMPPGYELQLLIGIDGCNDTERTLSSLKDDRMTVYRMAENYGTYITFNSLMKSATGDLIVRFDADDIMMAGYLDKQIAVFEADPSVSLTWTLSQQVGPEGESLPDPFANRSEAPAHWEIRTAANGQFMARRALWDSLGGFQPWRTTSDSDFLHRLRFLGFKEQGIQEVLYQRRIHPRSLTQSKATGYDSETRKTCREIMSQGRETCSKPEDCWVEPATGSCTELKQ